MLNNLKSRKGHQNICNAKAYFTKMNKEEMSAVICQEVRVLNSIKCFNAVISQKPTCKMSLLIKQRNRAKTQVGTNIRNEPRNIVKRKNLMFFQ